MGHGAGNPQLVQLAAKYHAMFFRHWSANLPPVGAVVVGEVQPHLLVPDDYMYMATAYAEELTAKGLYPSSGMSMTFDNGGVQSDLFPKFYHVRIRIEGVVTKTQPCATVENDFVIYRPYLEDDAHTEKLNREANHRASRLGTTVLRMGQGLQPITNKRIAEEFHYGN